MNFEGIKNRVERAEALVDGRVIQTQDRYAALRSSWREGWTPSRIVIAGLIGGFAMGVSKPTRALRRLGKIGGPKSLQMVSALSGLASSIQATIAAVTAKKAANTADTAAETADDAAQTADAAASPVASPAAAGAPAVAVPTAQTSAFADLPTDASGPVPRTDRRRPEPAYDTQPRPAEAATEVSEPER
ncbi:hypothetical protein [Luteimonas sp. FCS-9]|uniref:hypothetical protein n=1 Tax=Luteimonas sp. FCS-9 TaxID=1547516 RepID=UPI00063EB775|nr:hypothetical protein [Luteimonas sp. FCS-9]KLJ02437.1 hypothetical protein WQ56_02565 [Luteimonas sp. FCS-9]